jgi:hypothetical protein
MLLKTIIKLLLASIWIAIFNLFTLHSLEFLQNENFFHLGEVAKSLINFLFTNFYQFQISILVSILSIIFFIVLDYYYEKINLDRKLPINKFITTYTSNLFLNLFTISFITFLFFGVHILGIPIICYFIFFKIPYIRGWEFLLTPHDSYYITYSNFPGEFEFIYGFSLSLVFLFVLRLCFVSSSEISIEKFEDEKYEELKYHESYKDFPILRKLTSFVTNFPRKIKSSLKFVLIVNNISIRFLIILYLFYLIPSIYAYFTPVWFNWIGNFNFPIRFSQQVNAYIFIVGLFLVILNIIRHNKKIKRELLKEEIKKEVMDEIGKN